MVKMPTYLVFSLACVIVFAIGQASAGEMPAEMLLHWPDRRPVAMIFRSQTHWCTDQNPGGYFGKEYDLRSAEGIEKFREILIKKAQQHIEVLKKLGAQGMIFWDVCGSFQQSMKYVGDPRVLPEYSPGFNQVVDEYFAQFAAAGFRTGLTIRPTHVFLVPPAERDRWGKWGYIPYRRGDGPAVEDLSQRINSKETRGDVLNELSDRIRYAHERWGSTLFYMDSNSCLLPKEDKKGEKSWSKEPLPVEVMEELQKRHPDCLIIPEHEKYAGYYAYSAPYTQVRSSPGNIRDRFPEAFSMIAGHPSRPYIFKRADRYVRATVSGDVLMGHGWYGGSLRKIRTVYETAAALAPFQIRVTQQNVNVGNKQFDELDSVQSHLIRQINPAGPLPGRRVFITYTNRVPPQRLKNVLDVVTQTGCVIAWSQPEEVSWDAYWNSDNGVKCLNPEAQAFFVGVPDEKNMLVITNSKAQKRVLSVRINYPALPVDASNRTDIEISHREGLSLSADQLPKPDEKVQQNALDDNQQTGHEDGLLKDLTRESQQLSDDFKLTSNNFRFQDDILKVVVEPFDYRVLQIRKQ